MESQVQSSSASSSASPIVIVEQVDWASLKQCSVPRRSYFEALIASIVTSPSAEHSAESLQHLRPYLAYSDICLMSMQCLDVELRRLAKSADATEDTVYQVQHKNVEHLLMAFSFPRRLTRQDRLLLQKTQPEADVRQHNFWSAKHEFYSQLQKKLMAVSQLRKSYGRLWRRYLACPLPAAEAGDDTAGRQCRLLELLQDGVLASLTNATQLADFVMTSFESQSPDVAMCSSPCVFHLVYNYSLDYGPLFERLYELITPEGLESEHRGKFYKHLDLMLSSTNLPTARVAAFAKRIGTVCLLAPCHSQPMLIGLVLNLLRRHSCCQYLVHHIDSGEQLLQQPVGSGKFSLSYSLAEAEAAAAGYALWELQAVQRHWDLSVGQQAKKINRKLPDAEDFFDKQVVERGWDQVVDSLIPECLKQADALKEAGYASDEDVDIQLDGERMLAGLDGWQ